MRRMGGTRLLVSPADASSALGPQVLSGTLQGVTALTTGSESDSIATHRPGLSVDCRFRKL
jgi:hypothetical protein